MKPENPTIAIKQTKVKTSFFMERHLIFIIKKSFRVWLSIFFLFYLILHLRRHMAEAHIAFFCYAISANHRLIFYTIISFFLDDGYKSEIWVPSLFNDRREGRKKIGCRVAFFFYYSVRVEIEEENRNFRFESSVAEAIEIS
jgi:hypothetical protein